MYIDVLIFTDDQWAALDYDQRQVVYAAQKEKNERLKKFNVDWNNAYLSLIANGMARSSFAEEKKQALLDEYEKDVRIIADSAYDKIANIAGGSTAGSSGTIIYDSNSVVPPDSVYDPASPDLSLSYADRFYVVREYYMKISSPTERLRLFFADTTVKGYLGEYYRTMMRLLRSYAN